MRPLFSFQAGAGSLLRAERPLRRLHGGAQPRDARRRRLRRRRARGVERAHVPRHAGPERVRVRRRLAAHVPVQRRNVRRERRALLPQRRQPRAVVPLRRRHPPLQRGERGERRRAVRRVSPGRRRLSRRSGVSPGRRRLRQAARLQRRWRGLGAGQVRG